jgi:hypothetical protein
MLPCGGKKDLIVSGRYIDRYEDRGHGWKIAKRRESIDWARTDHAADSFLRDTEGLVMGARRNKDFSASLVIKSNPRAVAVPPSTRKTLKFIGPIEDRLSIRELIDSYDDAVCRHDVRDCVDN